MTNEEAIKRLEEGAPFSAIYNEEWEQALQMGINALKKQIPHIMTLIGNDFRCPNCNERQFSIVDGEIVAGKMSNYCSNCAQAFNWNKVSVTQDIAYKGDYIIPNVTLEVTNNETD